MLTGAILGAIILLLIFSIIFLKGKNDAYVGQVKNLNNEIAAADYNLATLAKMVQARAELDKRPIIINFTDDQIVQLSNRLAVAIKVSLDAENAAALAKLN